MSKRRLQSTLPFANAAGEARTRDSPTMESRRFMARLRGQGVRRTTVYACARWAASRRPSLQAQFPDERTKARIRPQWRQIQVQLDVGQSAVASGIGTIEPGEGLFLVAAPRVDLGDLDGIVLPIVGNQLVQCLLRLPGMPECVFGERDAELAEALVALAEHRQRLVRVAFQQLQLRQVGLRVRTFRIELE